MGNSFDMNTRKEPWRVKFSYQDVQRYDYWERMQFTEEQWQGLKKHAEDRGLTFLSTPFSVRAAEMLERMGMELWKISQARSAIRGSWILSCPLISPSSSRPV